jgi:uncharacterized protein YlxP (DUF503 family)
MTVSALPTLHIPSAQSVNGKRTVVHSLVKRLRKRLDMSTAELGLHEDSAQIGFATVSETPPVAHQLDQQAVRSPDRN